MTQYERCQSLIELQNSRLTRFDKSRSIQWNFNGIFWTGILVSTAFLVPNKNTFEFTWYGFVLLDVILILIHFFVIKMMQRALDYDKGKVAEYTLLAERELGLHNLTDQQIKVESKNSKAGQVGRSRQWLLTQLGISLLLLTCATIIILS